MKKFVLALALVSSTLSSCTTLSSPAPLAKTTIDEKTLIVALQTFDTTLTAIDQLVASGYIKAGSPKAIQLVNYIEVAKKSFEAAAAAEKLGNSSSYLSALLQAQDAIAQINLLVKGS